MEAGDGHPSLAASGATANVIVPGVVPNVANIVEDPVTPPEAAAASAFIITRGGRQHALRDVLQFRQMFKKANAKDVDLPNFADSSEDEENEEEEDYYPLTKDYLKMRKRKLWMMTTIVIRSLEAQKHLGKNSPLDEALQNQTLHLWVK